MELLHSLMFYDSSYSYVVFFVFVSFLFFFFYFFFQAEDGIRDLVRSRGLGDVYKRQTSRIKARNSNISALSPKLRNSA